MGVPYVGVMTHYDLVILGAGSGNTIVDSSFEDWSVAIVEQGRFGGTCLNRGCIPSKMFVAAADVADTARAGPGFDVHTRFDEVDWPGLRDRIFAITDEQSQGGLDYRESLDNVTVLEGTAVFTGPRALRVELNGEVDDQSPGEVVEVTADRVVIATGSRPVVPDIPGLDEVTWHTSDTIMRIETFPARLGIIGGGYVGAELAHVFSSLGSAVVQVDGADTLVSNHDADVAALFTDEARKRWDVRLEADLEKVERTADGAALLHLADGSTVEVDVVLVAVGRVPNNDRLDLGAAGVDVDDATGLVVVDRHQRASAEGVFALGDASSEQSLKHVANQDARVVQHNLRHPEDLVVSDHEHVPSAVFTSPQIASVGLTEAQAREQGIDLAVATKEYAATAHGWALRQDDTGHFVKVLGDRATGRLVGAHLIGPQASILVQTFIQALAFDQPVAGLARTQYWIHPSLTEVVEQALIGLAAELTS